MKYDNEKFHVIVICALFSLNSFVFRNTMFHILVLQQNKEMAWHMHNLILDLCHSQILNVPNI